MKSKRLKGPWRLDTFSLATSLTLRKPEVQTSCILPLPQLRRWCPFVIPGGAPTSVSVGLSRNALKAQRCLQMEGVESDDVTEWGKIMANFASVIAFYCSRSPGHELGLDWVWRWIAGILNNKRILPVSGQLVIR